MSGLLDFFLCLDLSLQSFLMTVACLMLRLASLTGLLLHSTRMMMFLALALRVFFMSPLWRWEVYYVNEAKASQGRHGMVPRRHSGMLLSRSQSAHWANISFWLLPRKTLDSLPVQLKYLSDLHQGSSKIQPCSSNLSFCIINSFCGIYAYNIT